MSEIKAVAVSAVLVLILWLLTPHIAQRVFEHYGIGYEPLDMIKLLYFYLVILAVMAIGIFAEGMDGRKSRRKRKNKISVR